MSLVKVCDMCGRADTSDAGLVKGKKAKVFNTDPDSKQKNIESGDLFDDRPIKLQVCTYNGENYNVFVDIKIEHSKDSALINEIIAKTNTINQLSDSLTGYESDDMMEELAMVSLPQLDIKNFKNPYPKLCSSCKREILKLVRSYGSENCIPKI